MRILVTCPYLSRLGGVSNHYLGLKKFWKEKVRYLEIGNKSNKVGRGKYRILYDMIHFLVVILLFRPNCIMLNPSIGKNALLRDFTMQRIAKLLGIKTIIFIHGFNIDTFEQLDYNWMTKNFNRSNLIFVLAHSFKNILQDIGVTVPIELMTTKVDDDLTVDFDINSRDGKTGSLLFLARVEKEKGIHETVDTFLLLKEYFPNLHLNIVGDGSELDRIAQRIKNEKLANVTMTGRLDGRDIVKAYENGIILILLTHGEGLPTTILEGMAFGLPIVTRPVGGIADFFENKKMGYMSDSLDPKVYAEHIKTLLENPTQIVEIARYNYLYAKKNFMASTVANKIETIIKRYI